MNDPANPIIIMAGYHDEMKTLVSANKGMTGRVKIIALQSYSDEELVQMLEVNL